MSRRPLLSPSSTICTCSAQVCAHKFASEVVQQTVLYIQQLLYSSAHDIVVQWAFRSPNPRHCLSWFLARLEIMKISNCVGYFSTPRNEFVQNKVWLNNQSSTLTYLLWLLTPESKVFPLWALWSNGNAKILLYRGRRGFSSYLDQLGARRVLACLSRRDYSGLHWKKNEKGEKNK